MRTVEDDGYYPPRPNPHVYPPRVPDDDPRAHMTLAPLSLADIRHIIREELAEWDRETFGPAEEQTP